MTRRAFLQLGPAAATATLLMSRSPAGADTTKRGVSWPIGCFNRPWSGENHPWGLDVALDSMKAAGYQRVGLLSRSPTEPLAGSDATPEYLSALKQRIAARALKVNMAALRTNNDLPLEVQIKETRHQIENARTLGAEFLLTFGVDKPAHFANYFALMRDAAPFAGARGVKLVLKPHGGASGAAQEIQRCL